MSTFANVTNPERAAAEITAKKIGDTSGERLAQIMTLIPEALKETGRKVAADPSVRNLLLTDKTTAKIALDSKSRIDLATFYSTYYGLKEFLEMPGGMYLLPTIAFANTVVDTTADTISLPFPNRVAKGDRVQFTSTGSLPGGLSLATDYWVNTVVNYIQNTSGTYCVITLSPTAARASTVDLTSQGSGTHTLTVFDTNDFALVKAGGMYGGRQLASFDRQLDGMFRYYWIEGNMLQVLPQGIAGSVAFAVPRYPQYVTDLGSSAELEVVFLKTLLDMATMNPATP